MPLAAFTVFLYFSYHLVQGDRGYFALKRLETAYTGAEQTLAALHLARMDVQGHVVRLRPGTLDLDLLDERSRVVLGFSRGDDLIIIPD